MSSSEIQFIPLDKTHLDLLHYWFSLPHVAHWWKENMQQETFEKKFIQRIDDPHIRAFIIHADRTPIGYIHYYDANKVPDHEGHTDPPGYFGLDMFIGEKDYIGKGVGTKMLQQFIEKILAPLNPSTIKVDPAEDNQAAISFYKKIGFKEVKPIKTPDGQKLIPGVLMELKIHKGFSGER